MLLSDFAILLHCKTQYYYFPIAISIFSSKMSLIMFTNNGLGKFTLELISREENRNDKEEY